eukprot:1161232-Pelagomonas_calceolata.AAC.2
MEHRPVRPGRSAPDPAHLNREPYKARASEKPHLVLLQMEHRPVRPRWNAPEFSAPRARAASPSPSPSSALSSSSSSSSSKALSRPSFPGAQPSCPEISSQKQSKPVASMVASTVLLLICQSAVLIPCNTLQSRKSAV